MKSLKYNMAFTAILVFTFGLFAQVDKNTVLYQILKTQDSILFNAAFNTCDTALLEDIFTEDFEFYHDKGGMTKGRDNFLNPMKENCAKINTGEPQPAKRILLEGSLEVFPLYKKEELYGAIQHGVHRFEFLDSNKKYKKGDVAKFTHVWIKENNIWKVKRELSYDHQYKVQ